VENYGNFRQNDPDEIFIGNASKTTGSFVRLVKMKPFAVLVRG